MSIPEYDTQWAKRRTGSVIALAVGFYLFLSLLYLDLPGLEYDETIFVNPALGNRNDTFMEWSVRIMGYRIPVMIMRYIGAVKSYLYAPIFALFGTSVTTVRLPAVFLGLTALFFTYKLCKSMFGEKPALLLLVLLAVDPSFIFATRNDWGPIAVMMVCKMASLYFLWRWIEENRAYQIGLCGLLMGVGFFDKINFLWYIGAIIPSALICFHRQLWPRISLRNTLSFTLPFLAGCAPLLVYNLRHPLISLQDQQVLTTSWYDSLSYRYRLFYHTFDGTGILDVFNVQKPNELLQTLRQPSADSIEAVLTSLPSILPWQQSLLPLALAVSLGILFFLFVRGRLFSTQRTAFLVLIFCLIVLGICLTALATGPHHVMMVYPFPHMLIALALWETDRRMAQWSGKTGRILARSALVLGVLCLLLSSVAMDCIYLKAFKARGGYGKWSDAIYRLAEDYRNQPDKNYILMDWGFSAQLLVMDSRNHHHTEGFDFILQEEKEIDKVKAFFPYFINPENLFIFHFPRFTTYPTLQLFQKAVQHFGLSASMQKQFQQRDGKLIYFSARVLHPELESYRQRGKEFYFWEAENPITRSGGGKDRKNYASNLGALGNFWGRRTTDFSTYRWDVKADIRQSYLGIRYASREKNLNYHLQIDDRTEIAVEFAGSGGYGDRIEEWRTSVIPLGELNAGEHRITLRPRNANASINLDYFYLAEEPLDWTPPIYRSEAAADAAVHLLPIEVEGIKAEPSSCTIAVRQIACSIQLTVHNPGHRFLQVFVRGPGEIADKPLTGPILDQEFSAGIDWIQEGRYQFHLYDITDGRQQRMQTIEVTGKR